jgi:hypothetical protein
MKFEPKNPPRSFVVGNVDKFEMKDCGNVRLDPDEQVTFVTESGAEYDLARKDWGFYATPSLNSRLVRFGLHAVMVKNPSGNYFIMLVEQGKRVEFDQYLQSERLELVCRLDTPAALERLERAVRAE